MHNKTLLEIVVTPIAVALVGVFASLYLGWKQDKNAWLITNTQLEQAHILTTANLQTQSIDIFLDALASKDIGQIELALKTLRYIPEDIRQEYANYIESYAPQIVARANIPKARQEQAESHLIQSAQAAAKNPKATINHPKGMNLRPAPLNKRELAETGNKPDTEVGDLICTLPYEHEVSIIEDGPQWTRVETTCPGKTNLQKGYISDFAGRAPLDIF